MSAAGTSHTPKRAFSAYVVIPMIGRTRLLYGEDRGAGKRRAAGHLLPRRCRHRPDSTSGTIRQVADVMRIESYADLARQILERPCERSRLIAIDGPGGAGKTHFAERLAAALQNAPIVRTDDFATGEPGDDWWPRLQSQVIGPLVESRLARYQRYDWDRRKLAEWRQVPPAPAVIIEGVSSARRATADVLTLAVWVHAPRATRLARGLDRDGEAARAAWDRWIAEEDLHFLRDMTVDRCEVLVDGAAAIPHNREREFVRLASCRYE